MTIPVTLVNNFGERMEGEINPKALTHPIDTLLERYLSRFPMRGFFVAFSPLQALRLTKWGTLSKK